MKLHAEDAAALDDGGERRAVRRAGDASVADRRGVGVREVDVAFASDAVEERRVAATLDRVPADVRHLDVAAQQRARAGQHAEPAQLRRLLAALEQELQPETDAEERAAAGDGS